MFMFKHSMTIKTITITEDAYESIKRLKIEDESFSELFKRLSRRYLTGKDILGALKQTQKEADEFRKRVLQVHEKAWRRV